MELCAQQMEKLLTDYLALSGPDFDPYYKAIDESEADATAFHVAEYVIPDLSAVPVAVLESHVAHMKQLDAERQRAEAAADAQKKLVAVSHARQYKKFAAKMNALLLQARENELGVFGLEHNEGILAAGNASGGGATVAPA